MAIEQALSVLSWYENLAKDEVPPDHLWEDSRGLEMWWAGIADKRERGIFGGSRPPSASDDSDSTPELVENDLARALKDG